MSELDVTVRSLILKFIDDAMEKQDRYVAINFFEQGPCVTIYPLSADEDD